MKRIDDRTVDLELHEQDALIMFDGLLDEGYGIVDATDTVVAHWKETGGPALSAEFIAYLKDEDL